MRLASRSRCQNLRHRMRSRKAASASRISATWPRRTSTFVLPVRRLTYHFTNEENGLVLHRYWTNACQHLRDRRLQCTTGTATTHHAVGARARCRGGAGAPGPDIRMRCVLRRETVEHPFGTLKMRMGATHFLMKTLPKVATEMALHVLAYNLTRVMNIVGIKPFLAAIRA